MQSRHPARVLAVCLAGAALVLLSGPAWAQSEENQSTDVFALLRAKSIRVRATGQDLTAIQVAVENLTGDSLQVSIPAGTYFLSSGQANNMASRTDWEVSLGAHATERFVLPTVQVNQSYDCPYNVDRLTIQASSGPSALSGVLRLMDGESAEFPVIQAAVWIACCDANYFDLGYLSHYAPGRPYDRERAIKYDETARALIYLDRSGTDITKKKLWQERRSILRMVQDEALREEFQAAITNAETAASAQAGHRH